MDLQITAPPDDAITAFGITCLATCMACVSAWLYSGSDRRRWIFSFGFFVLLFFLSGIAAGSGFLANIHGTPPPPILLGVFILLLPPILAFSKIGSRLASQSSILALVALQAFRLPLELLMHRSSALGICPIDLTYEGYNFDIFTGILAILLTLLHLVRGGLPPWLVWLFNFTGLLCLTIIAVVSIGGSPVFRIFGDEPQHLNTWVLYLPYVWLPCVLVVIAITGHLVLLRKLLAQPNSMSAP